MARTCILRAFGLQMSTRPSLVLPLFLFCFVFASMLSLKPRPFVQSFFDMQAPRQPHVFLSFFLCFFDVAFSEYFVSLPFSLINSIESTSYVFPFRMVFFYLVTTDWIFDISLCCCCCFLHINRSGLNHCCCCCCCLHIKNRSDLYPVPFSFLLFKAKKRISVVTR